MSNVTLIGNKEVSTIGRFRLDFTGNKKKLTLTNLSSFVPYGKGPADRVFFHSESGLVDHFFIDKPSISFKPDEKEIDRRNVTSLIQHRDVRIAQMSEKDHMELVKKSFKNSNPRFILTNVDKVVDDSYERETTLIQARAKLRNSRDLSKRKLIFLCSKFGIAYRSEIQDNTRYMQFLIKQLDQFLMKGNGAYSSNEAIHHFEESVEDIKRTEYIYYINELKAMEVIKDIGGIFKIGDTPVGADYDALITYYEQNDQLFLQHQSKVLAQIEGTIMA